MEVSKSISTNKTKKNTNNHSKIKTHKNKKYMDFQSFYKSKINNDNTKIINFLQSNPTKLQIDKLYDTTLYFIGFYFTEVATVWRYDINDLIFNRTQFNYYLLFIMNMNIINKIIKETKDEEDLYIETYVKQKYKRLKTWQSIYYKILELKEKKEYPDYHKLNFEKFKQNNIFKSHTNIITKNEINRIQELDKNNYKDLEYNFTRLPYDIDKSIIYAYNLLNHLQIMEVTKSISTTKKHKHSEIKTHKNKIYHSLKNADIKTFYKSEIYNDASKIIIFLQSKPTKLQIDKLYETTLYFIGFHLSNTGSYWRPGFDDLIFNRKKFNFILLFIMNMNIINKIIKEDEEEETFLYKKKNVYYPYFKLKKKIFEKLKKNNIFKSHTNIINKNEINSIFELANNNYEDLEYNWINMNYGEDKSIITAYNLLNHLNIM